MRIILISHGSFSKGLYETIQMVLGPQENMSYFGLYPENDPTDLENLLEAEIAKYEGKEEILILSDLCFGSPFNVAVRLMAKHDLYHITGINMPLLMETMIRSKTGVSASELCDAILELSKTDCVIDVRKKFADVFEEGEEK